MNKVPMTGKDIIAFAEYAKNAGTERAWMKMACIWIEGAEEHISMAFHPELGWARSIEDYVKLYEEKEVLQAELNQLKGIKKGTI